MKKIWGILRKDVVLSVSLLCALASCFAVTPSLSYLEYIDFNTLILLFCLMLIIAGLSEQEFFRFIGCRVLKHAKSRRQIIAVLVFLCFFASMLITNDVALITFVPFAVMVLKMASLEGSVCMTVTLLTIAANLGSMFTPIGNPQNLYLYSLSSMSFLSFMQLMFPYTLTAALLLALCIFIFNKRQLLQLQEIEMPYICIKDVTFYLMLFVFCLLSVAGIVQKPYLLVIVGAAVAWKEKHLFLKADYALLLTFVFFFIFIGNMNQVEWLHALILQLNEGHERIISIAASQIISNVPAAMLLSNYTAQVSELIIGTNLGGLGTLIASMASLISYKQIVHCYPDQKGRYLLLFTALNVLFLLILLFV